MQHYDTSFRHQHNMSDKDTSSAQSYYDKTAGALQSALGYVTGSTADQVNPHSPPTKHKHPPNNNLTSNKAKPKSPKPPPRTKPRTRPPSLAP